MRWSGEVTITCNPGRPGACWSVFALMRYEHGNSGPPPPPLLLADFNAERPAGLLHGLIVAAPEAFAPMIERLQELSEELKERDAR